MKNREIPDLIQKAERSLRAAKELLDGGYPDFSVSRAYYAMFYAAQAILLTKNLAFSKHAAVISAFGKEFIKTGILPDILHRNFLDSFDLRHAGDYGAVNSVTKETAATALRNAEDFVEAIKKYLESCRTEHSYFASE